MGLRDDIRSIIKEEHSMSDKMVIPPTIPDSRNFWHGGNLDDYQYNNSISQKSGRYEFGAGLYITTHYETAVKYSKGNRRLYIITVKNGMDIQDVFLPLSKVKEFINDYVIGKMKKHLWEMLEHSRLIENDKIPASIFNNIVHNENATTSKNTKYLRSFLVENGIDYEMVSNAFGWNEDMMVLYNMDKIINVMRIMPKDEISYAIDQISTKKRN